MIFPGLKGDKGVYMHIYMTPNAVLAPRSPHGHLGGHLGHQPVADGSLSYHIPALLPTRVSGHRSPLAQLNGLSN